MGIWAFGFIPETKGKLPQIQPCCSKKNYSATNLQRIGITLEEMDALFMKPMHKAVWAQLRGRPILVTDVDDVDDTIAHEKGAVVKVEKAEL